MKFRIRYVAPHRSEWSDVQADDLSSAVQWHHEGGTAEMSARYVPDPDRPVARVLFATLEVEGHGLFTSRIYKSGIGRRGGVKHRAELSLADVAKAIGWDRDPAELMGPGWDGEENDWCAP